MGKLELLYRGSLKSCNYHCSYCPFSKHRVSGRELQRDKEQWEHFVRTVLERAEILQIGAVMITPYGEALLHSWYWEGMARISREEEIEATGAQTNLSFAQEEMLAFYDRAGGDRKKLRLWATFHPEMVSVQEFSHKCRKLWEEGILLCAGAVGVPAHMEILADLREELSEDIYLWVNRMDGLKRSYTDEETESFQKIDPYFMRELSVVPAVPKQCQNRLFIEAEGRLRRCNISRNLKKDWEEMWNQYGSSSVQEDFSDVLCGRKYCSCYLAYGGRSDFMNRLLFGSYPVFRIPRRAKAVFLDVEGTLIPRDNAGKGKVPAWIRMGLEGLNRDGVPLFFATTLPYQEAQKRCREIWHLFAGGIFAGGAHVVVETFPSGAGGRRESVQEIEENCLSVIQEAGACFQCRILPYRYGGKLCKITMFRPRSAVWKEEERAEAEAVIRRAGVCGVRIFVEENCMQILPKDAAKEAGVRLICSWLHICPKEAAAAGDSQEDVKMLKICQGVIPDL